MKKLFKKYLIAIALISIVAIPITSYAAELATYEDVTENLDINEKVDITYEPTILDEGKPDYSKQIEELEQSIFESSITAGAAQFLLDSSPATVKSIEGTLKKQLAKANKLIEQANNILEKIQDEVVEDDLKKLRDSYYQNMVMIESARMLIETTPQTVKKVEKQLKNQIDKGLKLANKAEDILVEKENARFYAVKPIERKSVGLYYQTPTETEILNYWRNYESKATNKMDCYGLKLINPYSDSLYKTIPDPANDIAGALTSEALEDINHLTNTLRYSLGLHAVGLDQSQSDLAQASAVINFLNDDIDHYPKVPKGISKDSKLYKDGYKGSGEGNLAYGVNFFEHISLCARDDDETNWDVVGHRLWLTNPTAINFGYGTYNTFSTTHIYSQQLQETGYEIVAYPSNVGLDEFFNADTPFSISFKDNYDIRDVRITMTNLKTGRKMLYTTGYNIYTTLDGPAWMQNLSWGLGFDGYSGEQYNIKIDGVKRDGLSYPIEYTVNFISLTYSK